jgi:hypothetical protein
MAVHTPIRKEGRQDMVIGAGTLVALLLLVLLLIIIF